MARRRKKGRSVNGILLLDKPQDVSSNKALQQVKFLFNAAKAGHTGALDPLATGMLPICLGEATKFSQFLLESDKGYRVVGKLGERTDTCDSTGEIIETLPVDVSEKKLHEALAMFRGETQQIPSMFSALKHQGQPLYKLARKGIEVERAARDINVYHLELIHFENNQVELEIECSKGTYIRNIIDDLGQVLGCGAHVITLRRTFVANYPKDQMITLEQLESDKEQGNDLDSYLLPLESPVMNFDEVQLDDDSAHYFCHGQAINYPDLEAGELIRVYDEAARFLGMAEVDEEYMLAPKRLVVYQNN